MGFNAQQGAQQPAAPQQGPNPQMLAYYKALMPAMQAQQMGNAGPGMNAAAGFGNGMTKALLGLITANALKKLQPQAMAQPAGVPAGAQITDAPISYQPQDPTQGLV